MGILARLSSIVLAGVLLAQPVHAHDGEPHSLIEAPIDGSSVDASAGISIRGQAASATGISRVLIAIKDRSSRKWLRLNGSWGKREYHPVQLAAPGAAQTAWSFDFAPPSNGLYRIETRAYDVAGLHERIKARIEFTALLGVGSPLPTRTATQTATRTIARSPTPTITPGGVGPLADYTADSVTGPAPLVITFTDHSSGAIDRWQWSFGDGATGSGRSVIHSYLQPGTYSVRLAISGPDGSAAIEKQNLIHVSAPIVANSNAATEFVAYCPFSHQLADDSIVFPGQHGVSHIHSFFGSTVSNGDSTLADLLVGGTTCDPTVDRSSYWVPTLWENGQAVQPEKGTFYYFAGVNQRGLIRPFPLGLRMIAGNGKRVSATDGPSYYKWTCRGANVAGGDDFVVCPRGHQVELLLNFPDCWNGTDLDSADHKSHMAYSAGGTCPSSHPVPMPRLQFKLRYPTTGAAGLSLSAGSGATAVTSGRGFTAHGDFFNAWDSTAQRQRVESCLQRSLKCKTNGAP